MSISVQRHNITHRRVSVSLACCPNRKPLEGSPIDWADIGSTGRYCKLGHRCGRVRATLRGFGLQVVNTRGDHVSCFRSPCSPGRTLAVPRPRTQQRATDRMAHLTRAGNLWTPANTANLPTEPSPVVPVITMSWTFSNRALTSVLVQSLHRTCPRQGRRGLRDAAARPLKTCFLHDLSVHFEKHGVVVAAQRVVTFRLSAVCAFERVEIPEATCSGPESPAGYNSSRSSEPPHFDSTRDGVPLQVVPQTMLSISPRVAECRMRAMISCPANAWMTMRRAMLKAGCRCLRR